MLLCNHRQSDANRMTKYTETVVICVWLRVHMYVHKRALQKGKKICQVWNTGLACVKMNTVIGINDLMGV